MRAINPLVPVIIGGGVGTRLWPLSREAHPKQFIPLPDGSNLFQRTLARLNALGETLPPIIVGNEQHRFLLAEQLRQAGQTGTIILEPALRGTAMAVALAAVQALQTYDSDVLLLVLPADHSIHDTSGFVRTIEAGKLAAMQSQLVTFGVVPSYPETGYGYIQRGTPLSYAPGFSITQFVEKPARKVAERYLNSGDYYWNSGMFLFSAATFLQELLVHAPEIMQAAKGAMQGAELSYDFIRPHPTFFAQSPVAPIDKAVMEKTHQGVVLPLACDWNDVGAWDQWATLFTPNSQGNITTGDVLLNASYDCTVQSHHRLVVGVGVRDLVIVETSDAVLVMDKANVQDVKTVVSDLQAAGRKEVTFHRRVERPWGAFESIDQGERFQVKRITVAVGQKLSLQRHQHRSEHWIVVKGVARVVRAEETFLLSENESTYIPMGVNHRLENVGSIPLEIIEVQSGSYLGEDDIIRIADQYGRLFSVQ